MPRWRSNRSASPEANRLKSLVVAQIAHELRAPLNTLLGYTNMLDRESGGRERQRTYIGRIQRSGRYLAEIIDDLLDMSRLEAGRLSIAAAVARLRSAIEPAIADAEHQAAAKAVQLTNSVSGSAAELPYWGDEARVRQILVNLLTNAVKFTPAGGGIVVSGGTSENISGDNHDDAAPPAAGGPWAYVRVEDTGRGIAPDRLAAIFEPYEQAEASDSTRGVGLGLSISRRLARLMGGDLTVRSEAGAGSSFILWLPVAPSDAVPR